MIIQQNTLTQMHIPACRHENTVNGNLSHCINTIQEEVVHVFPLLIRHGECSSKGIVFIEAGTSLGFARTPERVWNQIMRQKCTQYRARHLCLEIMIMGRIHKPNAIQVNSH